MAAATVTGLNRRPSILGDRRQVTATSIAFASTGDTWTVPGIKDINALDLTPLTNSSYGFTVSGNVVTLVSGGAITFFGGVIGL